VSAKPLPDPEETLRRFTEGLARQVHGDGWIVARQMDGRSNRGFVLEKGDQAIYFFAKLSQNERGFWGLSAEKAAELARTSTEHLVLLTGAFEGYFIAAGRFGRLLPTFAHVAKNNAVRINEGKVSKEPRFVTLIRLWEYLRRQPLIRT
jgi:hypothetical protein